MKPIDLGAVKLTTRDVIGLACVMAAVVVLAAGSDSGWGWLLFFAFLSFSDRW